MFRHSIVLAFLFAVPASAATLDQFVDPPLGTASADSIVGWSERYAQTFTVGYTGSLTSIELYIFGSAAMDQPLEVDIRSTIEGKPSDSLSHVSVPADDIPRRSELPGSIGDYNAWGGEWLCVDVPDVEVTEGDLLAISLEANQTVSAKGYSWLTPSRIWRGDPVLPPYTRGAFGYSIGDGPWTMGNNDYAFRTYVERSPDVNSDGIVDGDDLRLMGDGLDGEWFLRWQRAYSATGVGSVPEPSGVVIILMSLIFWPVWAWFSGLFRPIDTIPTPYPHCQIGKAAIALSGLARPDMIGGMNGSNDGILMVVEGIDGAGKTTLVKRLETAFQSAGEDVISSHEPTNGRWGTLLRQSAQNGRMELQQELDLFVRDRHDHMERLVKPALAEGKIVILDRYFYSTIAYQGARGADVAECERRMREWFPKPDAVFLIDVHPQVGLERISSARGETPNHFERADALAEVRRIFNEIAVRDSLISKVDGHLPAEQVYSQVVHAMLDGVLKAKRCAKAYDCDVLYCSYRQSGECPWWAMRKRVESQQSVA